MLRDRHLTSSTRKLKLAMISSSNFKDYPVGGMTSFVRDISPVLSKYFDVEIIGIGRENDIKGKWLNKDIKNVSLPFLSVANLKVKKVIPNIFRVLYGLYKYKKQILNHNYDLLYFHGLPLNLPFIHCCKTIKIINHIHGVGNPISYIRDSILANRLTIKLYDLNRDYVIRKSDMVIWSADRTTYSSICTKYNKRIVRIPNFYDDSIFIKKNPEAIRNKFKISPTIKIIIYVGRLSPVKNVGFIVEAYKAVSMNRKDAMLVLVGDGEDKESIIRKIKALELEDRIILTGNKSQDEICDWLNVSDVFAFASDAEAYPIALLEALGCGVPIVAVSAPGVDDIVIDGYTGYKVRERNPIIFSQKLEEIIRNKKNFTENCLKHASFHTPERVGKIISDEIYNLMDAK